MYYYLMFENGKKLSLEKKINDFELRSVLILSDIFRIAIKLHLTELENRRLGLVTFNARKDRTKLLETNFYIYAVCRYSIVNIEKNNT